MKILLFGRRGQLGWELERSLSVLGELVALDWDSTDLCADFTRPDGLAQTVRLVRPDVIVNAAAHTAVDQAESEPERARTINALAPGVLAQEAARINAWLVHYSTDYVFDGRGARPWAETDTPAPLNVYGHTKWEGEQLVASGAPKHLIFRTSWFFAARGANFAKSILQLAQERDSLSVVGDQWGAPTGAELLADVTAHAIRSVKAPPPRTDLAGLYHLVAGGHTSWHGYAQLVLRIAQSKGMALKVLPEQVGAIATANYPTLARRPHNSRLNTNKIQTAFGLCLPPWQLGVERVLAEIL